MSQVAIYNKLPQTITVTILDADSRPSELRLDAHAKSDVMDEACITSHARQLALSGYIKIRAA